MKSLLPFTTFRTGAAWWAGWLCWLLLGLANSQAAQAQSTAPFTVRVTPTGPLSLPAGQSQVLTATATYPAFVSGTGFNSSVLVVKTQPDGKILAGGYFTSYNGQPCPYVARLNPDGSFDTSFTLVGTGLNGRVNALALQADGKIVIGGSFTSYNGNARPYVARLNANGTLDASFAPTGTGLNGSVNALVVQTDGKIVVGGDFTGYSASPRQYLARLTTTGGLDPDFAPAYTSNTGGVRALALQADGKVVVGGSFYNYSATGSATATNYIARFNPDGSQDASFAPPQVTSFERTSVTTYVNALVVQADGSILLGGYQVFGSFLRTVTNFVKRLSPSGSQGFTYMDGISSSNVGAIDVRALAVQADGKILVGEVIQQPNSGNNSTNTSLIRLTADGQLDKVLSNPDIYINVVEAIAVQPNGQVVIGGSFSKFNGVDTGNIARLNADGSLNTTDTPVVGATYTWSNGATGASITVNPTTTTTYSATATLNGVSATSNVVVVNVVPTGGAGLTALYQTGDLGLPTDNVIRPYLQLTNTGTAAVPYAQVTVRYWLTVEDLAPLVAQVDWAKLGTAQVSARYVALPAPRQGALGYLEYSFLAGAGSLAAGGSSGPILTSLHKQSWTNFDEQDDYSYAAASAYAPNNRLTVYLNGALVSGTEPAAVAATTSLLVAAGNQDTAPTTSAINVYLQVHNVGTSPVTYQSLTVRYWFTPDGNAALNYLVDYTPLGTSNVTLTTGQKNAEPYAELHFAAGLGSLAPLSTTGNVQFRIRKANFSAFTQTNDYSFQPSAAVAARPQITAYLNGQLVYGTEPTGALAANVTSQRQAGSAQAALAVGSAQVVAQAYPNPFTTSVALQFGLARTEAYTLAVYDMQGRLVEQLPGGEARAGEPVEVQWQASRHAAGLYLVRLTTPSSVQQLKLSKL